MQASELRRVVSDTDTSGNGNNIKLYPLRPQTTELIESQHHRQKYKKIYKCNAPSARTIHTKDKNAIFDIIDLNFNFLGGRVISNLFC